MGPRSIVPRLFFVKTTFLKITPPSLRNIYTHTWIIVSTWSLFDPLCPDNLSKYFIEFEEHSIDSRPTKYT